MTFNKTEQLLAGFAAAATMLLSNPAEACDCPINLSMPKTPARTVPTQPIIVTPIPDRVPLQGNVIPPLPAPSVVVQTIQHRPVDVATLDNAGAMTLITAKGYFVMRHGIDVKLDACVEGDADRSQSENYNNGLAAARAKETADIARDLDFNVVRVFSFGEDRAVGSDDRLQAESRRTITYIGLSGVFGDVGAADNCFQAAFKNDRNVVMRRGGFFVSPQHEAARDGEFRPPVRNTYAPKGLN